VLSRRPFHTHLKLAIAQTAYH